METMGQRDAGQRRRLPNTAFAYVDSRGRRKLPINDEAHLRNALARFNQTRFEDDAARERARTRLMRAAKKYGIVPIGFMARQLRSERAAAAASVPGEPRALPTGLVTFLLTDIEGSTGLLRALGDRYAELLDDVRAILRRVVAEAGGHEVDARADEFFAAFSSASRALEAALAIQRCLGERSWVDDLEVRVRIGIHSGRPTLTKSGYVGLAVHVAARVCSVAHGGQILLSSATFDALAGLLPAGITVKSLGSHRLHGLPEAQTLFQTDGPGLAAHFPPPRILNPGVSRATEG